MRRVDRGGIKLVFIRSLYASIFTVAEIYERKVSKFWKRIEIFDFLAHPVETPWRIFTVPHQNVCRCVPYISDHIW